MWDAIRSFLIETMRRNYCLFRMSELPRQKFFQVSTVFQFVPLSNKVAGKLGVSPGDAVPAAVLAKGRWRAKGPAAGAAGLRAGSASPPGPPEMDPGELTEALEREVASYVEKLKGKGWKVQRK